ncbi:MAG: L,D-transpeptidase family protein [Candidatus Obscuribacterales bacterium]|nr:L,D-transpeptidase family protein [Candidatus Obscuribacterales bacterium]
MMQLLALTVYFLTALILGSKVDAIITIPRLLTGCAELMTKLDTPKTEQPKRRRTMDEALKEYGRAARKRLKPDFKQAGIAYPPDSLTLVGLKEEKQLLLFAPNDEGVNCRIKVYPILAASGSAGPKLKQGDCQVPEGFYKIEAFNPASSYHLSLRVNYPNSEDHAHAKIEKRTDLGGDIMIHGSDVSVGCLAIGDEGIEELFVLVSDTGREKVNVLLAPNDLTTTKPNIDFKSQPSWLPTLYKRLKTALNEIPLQK